MNMLLLLLVLVLLAMRLLLTHDLGAPLLLLLKLHAPQSFLVLMGGRVAPELAIWLLS